ncbi:MAG: hypothetical protein QGG89_12725, partial [Vicinamibacterales bacterium]|nr:hypothetical protein [Vicinamibacterales bacterium]
ASVFSGHVISVVSLIWFFDSMRSIMESVDQGLVRFLPWLVLGGLALVWFGTRLVQRVRREER